jgi:hypothetical protein
MPKMRSLILILISFAICNQVEAQRSREFGVFGINQAPRAAPNPNKSVLSQSSFEGFSNQLSEANSRKDAIAVLQIFDAMEQQGAIPQPPRFAPVDPDFDALNQRLQELVRARDWVSSLRLIDAMTVYNRPFNKQRADALKAYRPKIEKISYYYIAPLQISRFGSGISVTARTNLPEGFRLELDIINGTSSGVTVNGRPAPSFAEISPQEKFATVSNRSFSFRINGFTGSADGTCTLNIGSPPKLTFAFPDQPPEIIKVLGRSFESFNGPQVIKGSKHVIVTEQKFSC